MDELAGLVARMVRAAGEAIDLIADRIESAAADSTLELGLASDDDEARTLGWPAVSVHRVVLGLIAARARDQGLDVRIVPRGSTAATAAAADAHRK